MEAMHIHDFYEIYMGLSDQIRFFVNDKFYLLRRGDVILFTNTDLHKANVPAQALCSRCVISFHPDVFCAQFRQGKSLLSCFSQENGTSHQLKLTEKEQSLFLSLAKNMETGQSSSKKIAEVERWLNLGQILVLLCKVRSRTSQEDFSNEPIRSPHTQKILQYIDKHYTEPISLDTLSAGCFLNKSYLCRIFKRETGIRIHDYIIYRRISHAMSLLRRGESVNNAARMSGFNSDTFFITVFREKLGVTPYQYAKKFQKKL